jgi:hypothetical protein
MQVMLQEVMLAIPQVPQVLPEIILVVEEEEPLLDI